MNIVTWLPVFRIGVPNTRFRCSVKANGATINLDGIEAANITGDVMGDVAIIAKTMDMMLY